MSRRGGRVLVLLSFVVAVIAVSLFVVDREQRLDLQHSEVTAIDAVGRTIEALALETRAGQQAYVAAGQGEGFWAAQVEASMQDLARRLESLRGLLTSPEASSAAESAVGQLAKLQEIDKQALEYVKADQRLMASDLVFTEGLGLTRGIVEQTRLTVVREREAREALRESWRQTQAWALALLGIVAIGIIAVLGLRADQAGAEPYDVATPVPPSSVLDELFAERPPTTPAKSPNTGEPGHAEADLADVAELCTDFARVIDPGELPSLLERSARLIDARGLIVWMVDGSGSRLKPALAYGYSQQALSVMGALDREADNATAAAFREARVHTVPASGTGLAALVAPLISAPGCVGVVAIEVPAGHETRPATRAMASILAAQLASLVAVPGTATENASPPRESATS